MVAEKKSRHLVSTRGWVPRHCIKEKRSERRGEGCGDVSDVAASVSAKSTAQEGKKTKGKKTKAKEE